MPSEPFLVINKAMQTSRETDPTAIMFGEDLTFGGGFRCSQGLREEFGEDRVFITPLRENGITASHGWAAALTDPWSGRCLMRSAQWHLAS